MRDLHPRISALAALVLVVLYTSSTVHEINYPTDYPDYGFYYNHVERWEPSEVTQGFNYHVKYAVSKFSIDYIHNAKVMPLALSVGLLVVSYLLAVQWSGKNYAGLIAVSVLAISGIFQAFDTSIVYDNSWTVYFLASLYFIKRKWALNPVFFIMGVMSKSLVVLFLPAMLYMIARSDLPLDRKMILFTIYIGMGIAFMLLSNYMDDYSNVPFNPLGFANGLQDWFHFLLLLDPLYAMLIPFSMLMLAAIRKTPTAVPVLALMLNLSLYGAFLEGMTDDIWNEAYRYVPLVAVFGASIGVIVNGFDSMRAARKRISISTT